MRPALIGAGVLICGWALAGLAGTPGALVFLAVVVVAHDAVFLPAVIGAGVLLRRLVPAGWQATVRFAAILDLALVVVALPLVLGLGRDPGNPSLLPRPYALGLVLCLVVTTATVVACRNRIESSREARPHRPPG
jgi:hypothetical protein